MVISGSAPKLRTTLAALMVAVAFAFVAVVPAYAADRASHADVARFLAGLPVDSGSPLARLTRTRSWRHHARRFDQAWRTLERRQTSKIRDWSEKYLTDPRQTLIYMFSGPDFLYADAFFPHAQTYVFAGLEPIGGEPDIANMSRRRWAAGLQHLRSSVSSVLQLSFFLTKEMKQQLRRGGFPGTLPVLYVFLARAGMTVHDVENVTLSPDGTLEPGEGAVGRTAVRITFSAPDSAQRKTLYYFRTNISDGGLKKSGFLKFLESLGPSDAFVKSASYLMHRSGFSDIRNLLLEKSHTLVQDDSGVPLRYFDREVWNLSPFGRYTRPIPLFSSRYQSDMRRLFASKKRKSISFGIGYRWRPGQSNVLLAVKKASAPAGTAE